MTVTEKQVRWELPTAEELVTARYELITLRAKIADFEARHPHLEFDETLPDSKPPQHMLIGGH